MKRLLCIVLAFVTGAIGSAAILSLWVYCIRPLLVTPVKGHGFDGVGFMTFLIGLPVGTILGTALLPRIIRRKLFGIDVPKRVDPSDISRTLPRFPD